MAEELAFKRILLKLSGEALKSSAGQPESIHADGLNVIAEQVRAVVDCGVQIALVVGAGNFFRGSAGIRQGIQRTTGDYMGMMATVMNALALRDAFENRRMSCSVQSALPVEGVVPVVNLRAAERAMNDGQVVIFAGGTGHPFFTTDTTAALRACEIRADAVLKATKVDGVYSADPVENPDAERYEHISFEEALEKRLGVMDSTAFSLCRDNGIKIVVYNFREPDALLRVMQGDETIATVVGN